MTAGFPLALLTCALTAFRSETAHELSSATDSESPTPLLPGALRCGFCERTWAECEADICPYRAIVTDFQRLLNIGAEQPPAVERTQ